MSHPRLTPESRVYRRKAAELSRLVDLETDPEKLFSLLHQALSWIQLAENEEALLADAETAATPMPEIELTAH